jgi:predicted secreted protein
MNPVTATVVFIIIWWITLFTVLPWGVSRMENPEAGHDQGAPARTMLGRKILITTGITIVLFGILYGLIDAKILSLQDLSGKIRI